MKIKIGEIIEENKAMTLREYENKGYAMFVAKSALMDPLHTGVYAFNVVEDQDYIIPVSTDAGMINKESTLVGYFVVRRNVGAWFCLANTIADVLVVPSVDLVQLQFGQED